MNYFVATGSNLCGASTGDTIFHVDLTLEHDNQDAIFLITADLRQLNTCIYLTNINSPNREFWD